MTNLVYQNLFKYKFLNSKSDRMVNVKKRNGRIEEFTKEKIASACQKAGASEENAAKVADEVESRIRNREEVSSREIGEMVIESLRKFDESVASSFESSFREKWK